MDYEFDDFANSGLETIRSFRKAAEFEIIRRFKKFRLISIISTILCIILIIVNICLIVHNSNSKKEFEAQQKKSIKSAYTTGAAGFGEYSCVYISDDNKYFHIKNAECFDNSDNAEETDLFSALSEERSPCKKCFVLTNTTLSLKALNERTFVTRSGECYHRWNCQHHTESVLPTSIAVARAAGYRPCSACY